MYQYKIETEEIKVKTNICVAKHPKAKPTKLEEINNNIILKKKCFKQKSSKNKTCKNIFSPSYISFCHKQDMTMR
jgi:hypothetical protein